MKLLVDMNLSPRWVQFLERNQFSAVHWHGVGDPNALDVELMSHAADTTTWFSRTISTSERFSPSRTPVSRASCRFARQAEPGCDRRSGGACTSADARSIK